MELVREKADMMGETEWMGLCSKVKKIVEYKKSDHVIDSLTDEIIIQVGGSDSESDKVSEGEIGDDTDDSQETDDDQREPLPCSSKSLKDYVEGEKPL